MAPKRCQVHLTLPCDLYDETYRVSKLERISIPEVIRRAMVRLFKDQHGTDLTV